MVPRNEGRTYPLLIYNLYAMLKYAIFFLVLLSGALAKSKTCKATPGKSSIKGKEFFQWQASKYWNQGPIPSYDPLKKVLENGERECRKTCEKSRPRSRCAAWEYKYSGSSGGTTTCNLRGRRLRSKNGLVLREGLRDWRVQVSLSSSIWVQHEMCTRNREIENRARPDSEAPRCLSFS